MIYSFSLQAVAIVIGLAYLLGHLPGIVRPVATAEWLRTVPRSVPLGFLLFGAAYVWTLFLVATIDLGEFSSYRSGIFIFFLALGLGVLLWARDYLAVRGFACLLCLAADVVLDAAFLHNEPAKLLYVTVAYVWVVVGVVLFFSPYRLRDAIAWATATPLRLKALSLGGSAFGLVLLLVAWVAL
ncbi:hypothetical protein SAMN05444156_1439 [Verrucomicrobium sp. GAS474]|uniref:hypothetical protein n=1 Tax=Verrucomicrobium sp. GAS474 TaxID=1882831 RepID=UPI00087D268C|nr:hypothetical protein [Verrucomicrobium sp. GAS474]SDU01250.1 hypothetical protein SAMN05444156_1439 [Verrucomicrobium sp. GAS474]